jgi:hypothetical protein
MNRMDPDGPEGMTGAVRMGLCPVGGAAALVAALFFRRWLGPELSLLQSIGIVHYQTVPDSGSVAGWFSLLQASPLAGLILLNFFDIVNYLLVGLIYLGLWAALEKVNRRTMTLAVALSFPGIAVYCVSNRAFAIYSSSGQYASAITAEERSIILAAGEKMLAMNRFSLDSGAGLGFILVNLAGLIIATVMLRSELFGRVTAVIGILANVLGLSAILTLAFAPPMTFIPLSASAPFLLVWYLLIAWKLLRLGAGAGRDAAR